jgi:putative peptidoglycan lipid II flippase
MSERKTLLRTAGSISLATLVSRVLGLARDQVQSYYFGAGALTDAFVAAFRIPNLLRDLFAEGALSSAFVPTFTAERERSGTDAAWRLANRVISALAVILGALTVLLAVFAPQIVPFYAPGFGPEKAALAVTMTRILSPFLLCVALAAPWACSTPAAASSCPRWRPRPSTSPPSWA